MIHLLNSFAVRLNSSRRGQDLTEYALLVALIAIVVVLAVAFFGEELSEFWSGAADTVSGLLDTGD